MAGKIFLPLLESHLAQFNPTDPDAPKAVLMGGGGNDLVDPPLPADFTLTRLYQMLVEDAASAKTALIEDEVKALIDVELKGYYVKILDRVTIATTVPILLHGYDYPIPDGQASATGLGPWLKHVFHAKGIEMPMSTAVMRILICRLNKMLETLPTKYPGRVHTLKLNGILEKEAGFAANYRRYWANELHATDEGFDILAQVVHEKLKSLGVK